MLRPGTKTYTAAAIAAGSGLLGVLGFLTPACQQHVLHMAVGLGLYGLRAAIASATNTPPTSPH